jgi:hypothetical protein
MSVISLPVSLSRNLIILSGVSGNNLEAVFRSLMVESITRLLLNTLSFWRNSLLNMCAKMFIFHLVRSSSTVNLSANQIEYLFSQIVEKAAFD